MGGEHSKAEKLKKYAFSMKHYHGTKTENAGLIGPVKKLTHAKTKEEIFLKETVIPEDKKTSVQYLANIEKLMKLSHNNLLKIIGFNFEKESNLCGSTHIIYIGVEKFDKSIFDKILKKNASQKFIDEHKIWKFVFDSLSLLVYLQDQDYELGNISLKNIVRTKKGEYKYVPKDLTQSTNLIEALWGKESHLLCPELFALVGKKEKIINHDKSKSDIFSFGLLLLHICTLTSEIKGVYDYKKYSINEEFIESQLKIVESQYSELLKCIISDMTRINVDERPDAKSLHEFLVEYETDCKEGRVGKDKELKISENYPHGELEINQMNHMPYSSMQDQHLAGGISQVMHTEKTQGYSSSPVLPHQQISHHLSSSVYNESPVVRDSTHHDVERASNRIIPHSYHYDIQTTYNPANYNIDVAGIENQHSIQQHASSPQNVLGSQVFTSQYVDDLTKKKSYDVHSFNIPLNERHSQNLPSNTSHHPSNEPTYSLPQTNYASGAPTHTNHSAPYNDIHYYPQSAVYTHNYSNTNIDNHLHSNINYNYEKAHQTPIKSYGSLDFGKKADYTTENYNYHVPNYSHSNYKYSPTKHHDNYGSYHNEIDHINANPGIKWSNDLKHYHIEAPDSIRGSAIHHGVRADMDLDIKKMVNEIAGKVLRETIGQPRK